MPPSTSPSVALAYSADADDAFMFHAIRAGLIDTGGFSFTHWRGDTAALNRLALGEAVAAGAPPTAPDVIAISAGVYPRVARALPAAAPRRVGRARLRPGGGRAPADGDRGARGHARRHPWPHDHRLAGAAPDPAGGDPGRDPHRPLRPHLRGARGRRGRRRAADPRRPAAVPRPRPAQGGRSRRVVAGRGRAAAAAGRERDPARPRRRPDPRALRGPAREHPLRARPPQRPHRRAGRRGSRRKKAVGSSASGSLPQPLRERRYAVLRARRAPGDRRALRPRARAAGLLGGRRAARLGAVAHRSGYARRLHSAAAAATATTANSALTAISSAGRRRGRDQARPAARRRRGRGARPRPRRSSG